MPGRPGLPSFHIEIPEVILLSILSSPVAWKVIRATKHKKHLSNPERHNKFQRDFNLPPASFWRCTDVFFLGKTMRRCRPIELRLADVREIACWVGLSQRKILCNSTHLTRSWFAWAKFCKPRFGTKTFRGQGNNTSPLQIDISTG